MDPTEARTRRQSSSGFGCLLSFCLLGLLGCVGAVLLIRWITRPGNTPRAAAIVYTWIKPGEELLDKDDPRGVVSRNTSNGDITIVGARIDTVPKWVPIFPRTQIESHFSITRQAQSPGRASFVDGKIELTGEGATGHFIYDFYKKELARQGFEIESMPPPYLSASTSEAPSRFLLVSLRERSISLEYTEWFTPPPPATSPEPR